MDCTLRDGGFVNDWNFGNGTIKFILQRLINAKTDFVEVGFLDQRRSYDYNRSIYPDMKAVKTAIGEMDKNQTEFVAMVDYGTCDIGHICDQKDTFIDGIRIIFKKPDMYRAMELGREIMEKGYFVTLQLVSVTAYEDRDILDFCHAAKRMQPYGVGIVDTYGLMHKEQMWHYFGLLDSNLDESIAIGYHSHNNFQLAYSNTIGILDMQTARTVILDGSAYGLGKSAGNAPLELLAMHLNEFYKKSYHLNEILEIIDSCVIPIQRKFSWGYSLEYFLAACNNCHPKYIGYLSGKATLSVESINEIAKDIEDGKKLNFDKGHIEKLYAMYQMRNFPDDTAWKALAEKYAGKDILLLAPGKSVTLKSMYIQDYIRNKKPVVIAVNFIPDAVKADGIFVGNSKRYKMFAEKLRYMGDRVFSIATSNVSCIYNRFDYVINIENVKDSSDAIADNSMAMALNLLRILGIGTVSLAGFDGYDMHNLAMSYCDECFNYSEDYERLRRVNRQLKEKIHALKAVMDISFLTESVYEE